ncbi:hypothetical protein SESBI_37345 [Sesbania bispinosa]|nr:hypothetical protein SESBI_37345 [Sesbania bispinosa]
MAEYFKVLGEQQMSADALARCLYALECAWHPMFTPLQGNCQLKSEEYAWLEKFSEDYNSDNSIWLFPNFSFSLAICRFYLEREASKDACIDSTKSSSSDLMKQALMLHPSVIKKLVTKVPLKDRTWTDILKHAFFRSDQTGISSQDHLINIYVERNYLIWRLPDLQKLLSGAAKLVIEALESNKNEVKDWACVRKEAFSSEKNEYGHLLVSDFSDSVTSIPQENLQQFMGVPGMREAMQDENQFANLPGNGHAPRGVANRNALAVLFESMLPWVTYEDREDGGPGDNQLDEHEQHNQ